MPVDEFTAAVRLGSRGEGAPAHSDAVDRDEVECLLANMIYKVSLSSSLVNVSAVLGCRPSIKDPVGPEQNRCICLKELTGPGNVPSTQPTCAAPRVQKLTSRPTESDEGLHSPRAGDRRPQQGRDGVPWHRGLKPPYPAALTRPLERGTTKKIDSPTHREGRRMYASSFLRTVDYDWRGRAASAWCSLPMRGSKTTSRAAQPHRANDNAAQRCTHDLDAFFIGNTSQASTSPVVNRENQYPRLTDRFTYLHGHPPPTHAPPHTQNGKRHLMYL